MKPNNFDNKSAMKCPESVISEWVRRKHQVVTSESAESWVVCRVVDQDWPGEESLPGKAGLILLRLRVRDTASVVCQPETGKLSRDSQTVSQTVSQSGTCGGEKYNKTKPPSSPGKFHQQIIPLTSRKQLNICSTLSLFILYYFIWFLLIFVSFLSISKKDN